jgi:RimJ/RimL family protein N-acetyltransferase
MPTILIRPITGSDADIAGFRAALDEVARERSYLLMTQAPPLERSVAFVAENIATGNPQFIALDGERVVGWCDVLRGVRETTRHVGTLGMGVIASHRGNGLGQRLITETIAAARQGGFSRIQLGVFATNARAVALYRKVGFIEEGVRRRAVRIGDTLHDEILMAVLLE